MFIMNDSLLSANKTQRIIDDPVLLQIGNDIAVQDYLIPSLILTVLMIIIGIPGNILIIAVYMKRWRKSTSRIFILALAFNDLFNCLFTMPVELYYILNILQTDDSNLCKTSRFLTFWTNDGSSLILMGIAFDRLQRICKPFKIQLSISTAKKIVAVSMLASLAVAWPSLLIYGTAKVPVTVGENKIYAKMCLYSDNIRIDPTVFVFFIMTGNSVLDVFFLVVYGIILYHVKNAGKELRKMSRANLYSDSGCRKMSLTDGSNHNCSHNVTSVEKTSNKEIQKTSKGEIKPSTNRRSSPEEPLTAATKRKLFSEGRQNHLSYTCYGESRRTIFSTQDNYRKRKTTIMLFAVTLLFIISFVPYTVLMTIRNFDSEFYSRLSDSEKTAYHFFIRSFFLSNALNPLIYGFVSEHFRSECKSVLKNIMCC
ncbi:cholecystokinin receptor type A-like [Saccostrea echinata]|uniref:cholecystokinin receptor type A-like n=1 Tax=Saccostrea echinata TaxID=191078 RepID=UPI002A814185|nr:cholecystokinin receptor type A-like [Saccostrea echinata]